MQVVLVRMGRGVNIQCSPAIFTTEGHRGAQRKQPVELRQTCLSARGGKGHEGGGRWSGLAFCPPWWGSVLPGSGGEQPENVSGNQNLGGAGSVLLGIEQPGSPQRHERLAKPKAWTRRGQQHSIFKWGTGTAIFSTEAQRAQSEEPGRRGET